MTPDERAARAERVIVETIDHFRQFATWFHREAEDHGRMRALLMEYAAEELARNARIAGIDLPEDQ